MGHVVELTLSETQSERLLRAARISSNEGLLPYPLANSGPWSPWHRLGERSKSKRALHSVRHRDSYRRAAVAARQLLEVICDAGAPAERRIGTLYGIRALGSELNPELDTELGRAIERCAHPRLRVALQRAADDELDIALLEEIEAADEAALRGQR